MLSHTEEPFVEAVAAHEMGFQLSSGELFPPFDETPVGWDTTNDVFGQTLLGTLPSGSQLGLNLALYPDLSANNDIDGGDGGQIGREASAEGDHGLKLSSQGGNKKESRDDKVAPFGNGSRHGSNDKLDGGEVGSPRGSSKSQQTMVQAPLGGHAFAMGGAAGKAAVPAPWETLQTSQTFDNAEKLHMDDRRLRVRNVNAARSPRPVRTRSLPKRLADSNVATSLPSTKAFPFSGALAIKARASRVPVHHQHPHQVMSSDQNSSGPSLTAGNSAQSQNNPVDMQKASTFSGNKRKHSTVSMPAMLNDLVAVNSKQCSPKLVRATSTRTESRGKPSFADLVGCGMMVPGTHTFYVGQAPVVADVCDDGAILFAGTRYRAVSKFALTVLRMRNPVRQSCDGWKEVSWNGEKLDKLRAQVAECMRMGHLQTNEPMVKDYECP